MEVGATLVAGAEALELVQPGECELNDPAHLVQSGTVCDVASGDQPLDAALPQQAAPDLADWLRHEPELRGLVTFANPEPSRASWGH